MSRGLFGTLMLGSAAVVAAHLGPSIDSAAGAVARAVEVGRGAGVSLSPGAGGESASVGAGDRAALPAQGVTGGVGARENAASDENPAVLVASAVELDGQG